MLHTEIGWEDLPQELGCGSGSDVLAQGAALGPRGRVRTGASDRGKPGSTAVAGPCPNVGNEDRMKANPAQIRKFLKGVDYYGEEQTLLRRAEANNADEKAPRRGRCRRRARAWMLVAGQ